MRYEDFVIQIGPRRGDGHPVQVLSSPAGEGTGFFRSPFKDHVLEAWLQVRRGLSTPDRHLAATFEDAEVATSSVSIAHDLGDRLFRALFSGQIQTLYDQSLGIVRSRPGCGLRVKLKLDTGELEVAYLSTLPWEFLWRKETEDFLSLSRLSPLVRYLDVPRPASPISIRSKLRILVAVATPQDLPPLAMEREKELLAAAWRRWKGLEVKFIERVSPQALRQALLDGKFHALHFMGHGGFDAATGEGVLFFEREDGRSEAVSGRALATMLKDFKSLGLVFLNACETARTQADGSNPFSGVANALVLGGLPSVVAMQFPISDQAAISFSAAFYQRLAAGDPIDAAVVEGRQAVLAALPGSLEWGTPVLFLRIPDASVFLRREAGQMVEASAWSEIAPYALLSLGSFLCALVILGLLLWKAELLVTLGLTGDFYYIALLALGVVVAGFLFGALRSLKLYRKHPLDSLIEIGVPVVGFALVVLGGFQLPPRTSNFPMTVYVHGEANTHELILRDTGFVLLDLGTNRRRAPIGAEGQAFFPEIPASFRGQIVNVSLDAAGYEMAAPRSQFRLAGTSLYLPVRKKPGRLRGRVQDEDGNPVRGAKIAVAGLEVSTDSFGRFDLTIPSDRMQDEFSMQAVATGYSPWNRSVVLNANEVVVQLTRRP